MAAESFNQQRIESIQNYKRACEDGDLATVRTLSRWFSPTEELTDADGFPYYGILLAVQNNRHNIVEYLYSKNDQALFVDNEGENVWNSIQTPEMLRVIVGLFKQSGFQDPLNHVFGDDEESCGTYLSTCCRNMSLELLREALDMGANPNMTDGKHWTCLMNIMFDTESLQHVKMVVEHSHYPIDWEHTDDEGRTILQMAEEDGFEEIAGYITSVEH